MPYPSEDKTSTTQFPTFASKDALLKELERVMKTGSAAQLQDVIQRLSNTTTSGWADPSGTLRP